MPFFGKKNPPPPPPSEPPAGGAAPEENPEEAKETQPVEQPTIVSKKATVKTTVGKTVVTKVAGDEAFAEFIPASVKPQSDVYTMMLVIAFIFFGVAVYLAGKELHEFYDVRFSFLSPYQGTRELPPPEKLAPAPQQPLKEAKPAEAQPPKEVKPAEAQPPVQGQQQPPPENKSQPPAEQPPKK